MGFLTTYPYDAVQASATNSEQLSDAAEEIAHIPVPTLHRPQRAKLFLEKANLTPPSDTPRFARRLTPQIFEPLPIDADKARLLLAQISGCKPLKPRPWYRRLLANRQERVNDDTRSFKKHDVARAFDQVLFYTPLESSGVAQAILSFAPGTSLYELWPHLHDPKLEEKAKSGLKRMTSRFRLSKMPTMPSEPWSWLDRMAEVEDLGYIRLMCQAGLRQEALDRTLSVALPKHPLSIIEVLLSHGAVASGCREAVRERLRREDTALVRLLLSTPDAMSVEAWRYCIEPYAESSPDALLLCLAYRPDVVYGTLLLQALASKNLSATTIILAYASSDEEFRDVGQRACKLTTQIEPPERRHEFFMILIESGCVQDSLVLREELLKDAKLRQFPLVKALTGAGVKLDVEPNNVISWAISQMDLELLELIKDGNLTSPVSPLLRLVPSSTSELSMIYLLDLLSPLGLTGEPLHLHLVRAVEQHHVQLVENLLLHGASVEYDHPSPIRAAIVAADFEILDILLRNKTSPEVISDITNTAMKLASRHDRFRAMETLLQKGVLASRLAVPLRTLVAEKGEVDLKLIKLLLRYKAPVDSVDSPGKGNVSIAAQRGDVELLKLLCDAGPRRENLSEAILIASKTITIHRYDVVKSMIEILLCRGACGTPLHETLLCAAKNDNQLHIVRLLIKNGAKADYKSGACFEVAIRRRKFDLLKILCRSCPPSQKSTESVLPLAIDPCYYDLPSLQLLLSSTSSATVVLSTWVPDQLESNPNITSIVPCLLQHGLDVDAQDGFLLRLSIQKKRIDLLRTTLDANPSIKSLRSAFGTAIGAQMQDVDLEVLKLLLEKAESSEIGQSRALTKFTRLALDGDPKGLKLLLQHEAKIDQNDEDALLIAANSGSYEIVQLLLSSQPAPSFVKRVCLSVGSANSNTTEKAEILNLLLNANGGLSVEDVSALLDDCVVHDHETVQLSEILLVRGAEVGFKTLMKAMLRASPDLIVAMTNHVKGRNILIQLFEQARTTLCTPDKALPIYRCLLNRNSTLGNPIPQTSLHDALFEAISETRSTKTILRLLLQKGADPNKNKARCFVLAARAGIEAKFCILSQYANLNVVLPALLDSLQKETQIVRWFRICLEGNHAEALANQDKLLFDCLRKFPNGTKLLELLLDNGVPASATLSYSIGTGWKSEKCTVLIWAIFREPKIGNETILTLIEKGHGVIPNYSTPVTGVSAAFGCLLDTSRIPILKALIRMDKKQLLSYEIPRSSFAHLVTSSEKLQEVTDLPDKMNLHRCSFYLGNIDAFRLLDTGLPVDETPLHLAALFALPSFVKLFMETCDPNIKEEAYDFCIPLALACKAQPQPWCKIADMESEFRDRRRETMQLLAAATNLEWRSSSQHQTVLHIAMEAGIDVAEDIIYAARIQSDPKKASRYTYLDKGSRKYTPQEYVMELMDATEFEKEALLSCLANAGFVS